MVEEMVEYDGRRLQINPETPVFFTYLHCLENGQPFYCCASVDRHGNIGYHDINDSGEFGRLKDGLNTKCISILLLGNVNNGGVARRVLHNVAAAEAERITTRGIARLFGG